MIVTDDMELPIPGVVVAASSPDLAAPIELLTDENGTAFFGSSAGTYCLTVTKAGFGRVLVSGVSVEAGRRTAIDMAMLPARIEPAVVGMPDRRWLRRIRLDRLRAARQPKGLAELHVATDPERWKRLSVRCDGSALPVRADLEAGEAVISGLPEDTPCTARLAGGARPLEIDFVAGDDTAEVDVRP